MGSRMRPIATLALLNISMSLAKLPTHFVKETRGSTYNNKTDAKTPRSRTTVITHRGIRCAALVRSFLDLRVLALAFRPILLPAH